MAAPGETALFLDNVLNELQVTDRVFHALKQTMPLVEELVATVRELAGEGRILVVGSNSLLATALHDLGYQIELWHLPGADLTGAMKRFVSRTGDLDALLTPPESAPAFDIIVLPYVLEAASESPALVLSRLRSLLRPGGCVLIASASVGRLLYRLRGLTGRSQLPEAEREQTTVSLSWPALAPQRTVDRWELGRWARRGGFAVEKLAPVMDTNATNPIVAMRLQDWLIANAAYIVRSNFPALRDCLVATLRPLPAGGRDNTPAAGEADLPLVSVVVSAEDRSRSEQVLGDLKQSTYPRSRMEAIFLHPQAGDFGGLAAGDAGLPVRLIPLPLTTGPAAANLGLKHSAGEVVAFTDDRCRIPPPWVESGVAGTAGWTAAVTGEVVAEGSSLHPVLALPGSRGTANGNEYDRLLFPSCNSFYLREGLAGVGGFDESQGAVWGWDSDAAYRLEASGFATSFENTIFLSREFPVPAGLGWVREEYRRAQQIPMGIRRMPALRRTLLKQRVFLTSATRSFDLTLAGLALVLLRRRPAYLLLALPWGKSAARVVDLWPPAAWPRSLGNLGMLTARQLVWLAGLAVGSAKARQMVL